MYPPVKFSESYVINTIKTQNLSCQWALFTVKYLQGTIKTRQMFKFKNTNIHFKDIRLTAR